MATDLSLEKWQLAFDTQARVCFCLSPNGGEVYEWWRADYWVVLFNWWTDRRLATLGGNGIGEGGD